MHLVEKRFFLSSTSVHLSLSIGVLRLSKYARLVRIISCLARQTTARARAGSKHLIARSYLLDKHLQRHVNSSLPSLRRPSSSGPITKTGVFESRRPLTLRVYTYRYDRSTDLSNAKFDI